MDPYEPLPGHEPLVIEAIALDWKWLFIYPEHNIGTINEIAFPVGHPVSFRITSEVAMNSFMIPDLGGQIYAMAGMESQLNLKADRVGSMRGRNMQFTGDGFASQTFEARSLPQAEFDAWVKKVKQSPDVLSDDTFAAMSHPSVNVPAQYFASVPPGFFRSRLMFFKGSEYNQELVAAPANGQSIDD
ncbi:MAG: COX aromatic rich motif-containing protein [Rhizobiaceae bacterium]